MGAQGPAGPQGSAGVDRSRIQAANLRTVYGPISVVQPAGEVDVFASCASGERLLGGGWLEPDNTDHGAGLVLSEGPAPSAPTSGWFVRFRDGNSAFPMAVQASAVCLKLG